MTSYKFATVDPRPFALEGELAVPRPNGPDAGGGGDDSGRRRRPHRGQHRPPALGGDATTAAIEAVVTWPLPPRERPSSPFARTPTPGWSAPFLSPRGGGGHRGR